MTSDGLTEGIQYQHAEWVSIHPYFREHFHGAAEAPTPKK